MDYLDIVFKGYIIGLMASIPLGPIGVICVQRTINGKFLSGFASGCGAVFADTVFAMLALLFFSIIEPYLSANLELIKIIGGVIITAIGLVLLLKKGAAQLRKNRDRKRNIFRDFISIFVLTVTNPTYILVFIGLFSYFKIGEIEFSVTTNLLMILGVICGALSWWFVLTFTVNLLRKKFTIKHIFYINRLAGILITILGLVAIVTSIIELLIKKA